jgi:hypothetical protein
MAELSTISNSGDQTTTDNPQVSNSTSQTSSIQPVTPSNLLTTDQNSIPLYQSALPSIALAATQTGTTSNTQPKVVTHKYNPVTVGVIGFFILIVIVAIIQTINEAKTTTK